MKRYLVLVLSSLAAANLNAQTGQPYIHDPSTIAECEGKYYTFGLFLTTINLLKRV